MKVAIYASGTTVHVQGDLDAAFEYNGHDPIYLAFSDGTVLCADFTEARWNVQPVVQGSATYGSTASGLTDLVRLDGDLTWVVVGTDMIRTSGLRHLSR